MTLLIVSAAIKGNVPSGPGVSGEEGRNGKLHSNVVELAAAESSKESWIRSSNPIEHNG